MTLKEQLIREIEQASEETLMQLMELWQQTQASPQAKTGFMRFAGIAKPEIELLKELEQEIEANRELDLHRPLP